MIAVSAAPRSPAGRSPAGRSPARHRSARPLPRIAAVLGAGMATVFVAATVVVLGIGLSGLGVAGTYAFLNSSQPLAVGTTGAISATMSSGTTGLVVSSGAITLSGIYPGQTRSADFTVSASGSADLLVNVASITGQGDNGLSITVAPGTCASAGSAVAVGALGVKAVAATTYDSTTTAALVVPLCLVVSMAANAPASAAGATTAITLNLTGAQP